MDNTYWKYGELAELARRTLVSRSHVCDAIHRRRSFKEDKALIFEDACRDMGRDIPASEWMNTKVTVHPAFVVEDTDYVSLLE